MAVPYASPFYSFWMAGYECADHQNKFGERVDLLTASGHLQLLAEDYHRLKPFHIHTVREGIRWSQVERTPYQYDWSTVAEMMREGAHSGVQQVWDICHFGFPDDITPLHPHFPKRFAALCRAFVRFYRSIDRESVLIVTPINEVSFLSWLGGDACGTAPYCVRQGWEVKYHLMRAYIQAVIAMREEDPDIRILTTEPLVHVIPPADATYEQRLAAERLREDQFQAIDMLCGRICPELGGSPDYADMLGFNFYHNNQWCIDAPGALAWCNTDRHPEWRELSDLLKAAYIRYDKPMVLTETSHSGEDRPHWIEYIAAECASVIEAGIPLWGICLYPIIDRPDWDFPTLWHHSGLWDEPDIPGAIPARTVCKPYASAIHTAQIVINHALESTNSLLA